MGLYGLIGKSLSHSFSKRYFEEKHLFNTIDGSDEYVNFELTSIKELNSILESNPDLEGFNVTIPFKSEIMSYLDTLSEEALDIGSVNVVKISKSNGPRGFTLKGFNTDHWGFIESIRPCLKSSMNKALILGTGGSSNAVSYALDKSGVSCMKVTRGQTKPGVINYLDLSDTIIAEHLLIVNTTPLGTWPQTEWYPKIPFQFLTPDHLVFDLVYNPPETSFMKKAMHYGAKAMNGYEMLCLQADRSLMIWKS
jgi:shikimate dehydrogenase